MKIEFAALAAVAALISLDGHAGAFATIGAGAADWPDCGSGAVSCDRREGAWFARAGVGIPLVPFLGVEARYANLGRSSYGTQVLQSPPVTQDVTVESKGAGVGAVLQVPIPLDLTLSGVAGLMRMKTSATLLGFSGSLTKTNPYYGVGIDYRLNNSKFSVGAEATRYRVDFGVKDNVDTYTVSFTFRFL